MRLASFRVQKYRSIEDSEEIKVDENITTFVGINESGKTNLMRALKKINQSDRDFDDLIENPTWYFGSFDPEEIFITVTFKLNDKEKQQIEDISNGQVSIDEVKFSKNKNMDLTCHLNTDSKVIRFATFQKNYLVPISEICDSVDPTSFENGQEHKNNVLVELNTIGQGFEDGTDIMQPDILDRVMQNLVSFTSSLSAIPDNILDKSKITAILNRSNFAMTNDSVVRVKNYLTDKIPKFIYFENTSIIDSRINLPTFISKLDANNLDKDEKTAKTLLDLGNLDAHELLQLGQEGDDHKQIQKNKDRLDLILSHASKKVSEEIDNIWSQNAHDIEFSVHGNDLRVWVKNRSDGIKLQLEERSRGYQWYFSFYTVFNVESEQGHKDAIILLDEPALFLHAKGQEDFLNRVLPLLVKKNQIIYTTHSPFMVDLTKPDSIHTVTLKESDVLNVKQKISHISNENWDRDKDALFPLQSALHYTMAQSMFIGRKNLIVEGVTDFWLLASISSLLEAAGKVHLNKDFVFVPAGGGTKSALFAITYKSQGLDVAVLLDGDREGGAVHEQIVKNKILREKNVSMLNEIFDSSRSMSIEDIFQEEYYLRFVHKAYKNELLEKGISEIVLTSQDPMIVKRIEDFFNKIGLKFNKSRPDRLILTEMGHSGIESLHSKTVVKFEKIFAKINKMLS